MKQFRKDISLAALIIILASSMGCGHYQILKFKSYEYYENNDYSVSDRKGLVGICIDTNDTDIWPYVRRIKKGHEHKSIRALNITMFFYDIHHCPKCNSERKYQILLEDEGYTTFFVSIGNWEEKFRVRVKNNHLSPVHIRIRTTGYAPRNKYFSANIVKRQMISLESEPN